MAGREIQTKIDVNLGNSSQEIGKLKEDFKGVAASAKDTEETFEVFNNTLNQSSGYARQLREAAEATAKALSTGMSTATEATKAQTAATKQLKSELDNSTSSANGIAKSLTTGYNNLRKLAYLIPGIGIGGIVALALDPFINFFSSLNKSVSESDKIIEAFKLKNVGDTIAEAVGGTEGDITRVQALSNVIQNTNTSYIQRQRALESLKEVNKSYFGDLTLEDAATGKLTNSVNTYTNALVAQAVTKGYLDQITQTTIAYNKQAETVERAKTALDAANKAVKEGPASVNVTVGSSAGGRDEGAVLQEQATKAANAYNIQRDALEKLGTQVATYRGKVNTAIAEELKNPLIKPEKTKTDTDNSLKDLANYISESQKISQDAEEKEITSENIKYHKIFDDLTKHHHNTESLTEQHEQNLVDIHQKYFDQRQKKIADNFNRINTQVSTVQAKGLENLLNAENSYFDKSDTIGKSAEDKKVIAENQTYDKLISEAMLYGQDIEAIEKQHQTNLAAIRKEAADKQAAEQAKKDAEEVKKKLDKIDSLTGKLSKDSIEPFANSISITNDGIGEAQAKILNDQIQLNEAIRKGTIDAAKAAEQQKNIEKEQIALQQQKIDIFQKAADGVGSSIYKIGKTLTENSTLNKQLAELKDASKTINDLVKAGSITEQQAAQKRGEIHKADNEIHKKKIDNYASEGIAVGESLVTIGQLLGEHTQAGKDFEIAGATISAISSAVKSFDSLASIPYVGPELGAIAAAAALAAGYANIRKIEAVQVPGQGSSTSTALPPSVYTAPRIATTANQTNLSQATIDRINQTNNNNPIRAYVVESDLRNTSNRVAGYASNSALGERPH